jgi:hypothetical protein
MKAHSPAKPEHSRHHGSSDRGGHGHGQQAMTVLDSRPELEQQLGLLSLMAGSPRLQRKCACGSPSAASGSCAACEARGIGASSDVLQKKLAIGSVDDPLEREADRVADQVMRMTVHAAVSGAPPRIQRFSGHAGKQMNSAPASVDKVLASSGSPLEPVLRQDMEQRFGHDFSRVRIHTGSEAMQSTLDVSANAYAVRHNIVFGARQFAPNTIDGQRLLAHELVHVIQQESANPTEGRLQRRYTPEERRAMREGRVVGTSDDIGIATSYGFEPGDIVFRLGSRALADQISNPVTHGGIYLGDGLIHDMVGFGNRTVRATLFYREADDPSVVRVIRFVGPHRNLIVQRLLSNIRSRDFRLPTDPRPWNLFSSADDYRTATCLEYSHAQFLYAIRQVSQDQAVSVSTRDSLLATYFARGSAEPSALIQPQTLTVQGRMGIAINERRALVAAASASGDSGGDVDPSVFENRWEGEEELRQIGSSWAPVIWQVQRLRAFTYQSFVDSRQFFRVISPPVGDFNQPRGDVAAG